jgi:hypothetical protein
MREGVEFGVERGERRERRGVGVNDGVSVRPRQERLDVDRVFDVPAALAVQDLAAPLDEHNPVVVDLVEAVAGGLHPHSAALSVAAGGVPPDHIAESGRREGCATIDYFLDVVRVVHASATCSATRGVSTPTGP